MVLTLSNTAGAMYPPVNLLRTIGGNPFTTSELAVYFNYTMHTFNASFLTPPSICTSINSELSQRDVPFIRRFAFI